MEEKPSPQYLLGSVYKNGEVSLGAKIAVFCGAAPLLVGISIFLLWLVTRWEWFKEAGFFTLFAGAFLGLIGAIALAISKTVVSEIPGSSNRRLLYSPLFCAALLLVNYPVAGGIIAAVVAIETCYTVVVSNATPWTLDDVRVFGGGCDKSFGSIPPGGASQRSFWIQTDGVLEFRAVGETTEYSAMVDGYVSNGFGAGGYKKVIVKPDGSISIEDLSGRAVDDLNFEKPIHPSR